MFQRILADRDGRPPLVITADEKERVLLGYYASIREVFYSDHGALGRMKKIARYFTQGLPQGGVLRQAIYHSQTIDEATSRIRHYFDALRALERGEVTSLDGSVPTARQAAG